MGNLPKFALCSDGTLPSHFVFPVWQYEWLRIVDDVYCNYHQLCLLLSRGAVGKEKANDRDADDAQNRGLCLDDLHGTWLDWEIVSLENCPVIF